MFEGLSSMTPLVCGRCPRQRSSGGAASRAGRDSSDRAARAARSVDLGPVGYFRILDVRNGDPVVLVAEPAERPEWPYELVIRADGVEQRRAFMSECSWSPGERVQWPAERGQTPVEHEVGCGTAG